jgi:hypothetical protein
MMNQEQPSSVTNNIELKERIKDMVIVSPDFVYEKMSFFSILQDKEGLGNINVLDYVEKAVDKVMNTPEDVCLNAFREMAGMSHLHPYKFIRTMLAKEVIQIKYGLDAEDSIVDFFGWLAVYYRYMIKKGERDKNKG